MVFSFDEDIPPYMGDDGIEVEGDYLFNRYFLSSEKERLKHLFFVEAATMTALGRSIALEDVVGVNMRRDDTGVMHITRVISADDPEWLADQGSAGSHSLELQHRILPDAP